MPLSTQKPKVSNAGARTLVAVESELSELKAAAEAERTAAIANTARIADLELMTEHSTKQLERYAAELRRVQQEESLRSVGDGRRIPHRIGIENGKGDDWARLESTVLELATKPIG